MELNRVNLRDANLPPQLDEFLNCLLAVSLLPLSVFLWIRPDTHITGMSRSHRLSDSAWSYANDCFTSRGDYSYSNDYFTSRGDGFSGAVYRNYMRNLSQLPHRALPFVNDAGAKGPKTTYDNEEIISGLRRYVLENFR